MIGVQQERLEEQKFSENRGDPHTFRTIADGSESSSLCTQECLVNARDISRWNPKYRAEDRSCRPIKACEPPLGQATCDRFEITTRGINYTAEHLFSLWDVSMSIESVTRKVVRFLRLYEPPLEEGKVRVRWQFVRSQSYSAFMNHFIDSIE